MPPAPPEDDLDRIRAWFERLAEHVRAVDFAGARPLFAADMIAFGTFSDFVSERDAVEAAQWRNVWPVIDGFRWRPAAFRGIVSPDRLAATVALARQRIGDDWVAQHTHFSLFRGVPGQSFGKKG